MKENFLKFVARHKSVMSAWAAVLVMVTLVSVTVLGLAGCAGDAPTTPTEAPQKASYSVKLVTNAGKPLEKVGVFIYADEMKSDLVAFARTDSNGVMTFTAKEGRYAAFLDGVPVGYAFQTYYEVSQATTEIVLDADFREPAVNMNIGLGDIMCEMTVNATDGQTYKLSELLQKKDMVMLNFWFLDCPFCIEEFPYLQEAYNMYQDEVAILAVNPVDTNKAAIENCRKQLGLTFPVAAVGSAWQSVLNIQSYPTSVIIDRYGMVCLITGTMPNAEVLETLFAYYTADNYTQTVAQSIDDVLNGDSLQGTALQPLEIMGMQEFDVTVPAGGKIYYNLYRVFDMVLTLENANATITMGDTTVTPVDGVISMDVESPNTFEPLQLVFGNTSQQEQTYKVKLSFKEGTQAAPYPLTLGTVNTEVEKDNAQGVFYLYEATQAGTLGVTCVKAPDGVSYGYVLYNLTSGSYINEPDSDGSFYIVVEPGDQVQVSITAIQDAQGNMFPGGSFETLVFLEQSAEPQPTQPQPTEPQPTEPQPTEPQPTDPQPTEPQPTDPPAVQPDVSDDDVTEFYMCENAYNVYVGNTRVLLGSNQINYGEDSGNCFFIFNPEVSGVYRFTTSDPAAVISYWGGTTHYAFDQTSNTDYADNAFTINVKDSNIGSLYIIGIQGASSCELIITRISDAELTYDDLPYERYQGIHTPVDQGTAPAGTFVYFDLENPDGYQLVLNETTGYYHLGSLDGPVVYMRLATGVSSTPLNNLSFATILSNSGIQRYYFDADGEFVAKIDFSTYVTECINCVDSKGMYPLTQDLMRIVKDIGEYKGWWDAANPSYQFGDYENLNAEIAWMYACGYYS